jgi:hypothetical protein
MILEDRCHGRRFRRQQKLFHLRWMPNGAATGADPRSLERPGERGRARDEVVLFLACSLPDFHFLLRRLS